jgi:uncharacterized protein (DUF488 family)
MSNEIFSLGHSSLAFPRFLDLLKTAEVTAVADVRSSPFSGRFPWFSQREMKGGLKGVGIAYAFLGKELGGRPTSPELYRGSVADYDAMAKTDVFRLGIQRLLQGSETHRIAMVCSERDPLHCHRCLLVGRRLAHQHIQVTHLNFDGGRETQCQVEDRLLREEKLFAEDLLKSHDDRLAEAYLKRSRQVAYALVQKNEVQ